MEESGSEAAIHAMHDIFKDDGTEAILLIDAENAFNVINRKVMLKNISVLCPIISTFIQNCYCIPSHLYIIGGTEILSKEGTTQGDPTAMAAYALALTPLLRQLIQFINEQNQKTKEVAFADDITAADKIEDLKCYWDEITTKGPNYGYYPKASKSHLIVKEKYINKATNNFQGLDVQITTAGERHLGAVIGSMQFKEKYVANQVGVWNEQLIVLSNIAEIEPQVAYVAFVSGFKHKLTYFMRTIPDINTQFTLIEETIRNRFIPAITGGHVCSNLERELFSLPVRYGGLGIPDFTKLSSLEYDNSRKITNSLVSAIKDQVTTYGINKKDINKIKNEIKSAKEKRYIDLLKNLKNEMSEPQRRINLVNCEKGASSWLNVLPLPKHGFNLTKQQFWDALRLRYGWSIPNLPTTCACGSKYDIQHCMSCKKGGFINIRHNDVRDLTACLLTEVCKDVSVEPLLTPLTGENIESRSAKTGDEARLDISARDFWVKGQKAFFDVRVFDPNASRYVTQNLQQCYARNEKEKKNGYVERILNVEHASFTPLVFTIQGGMSREAHTFYNRLSDMIANKRKEPTSVITNWIRTKLNFALLKSCLLCLRGSRTPWNATRNITNINEDVSIESRLSVV